MKTRELEKLGFERAGVYNAVIDGWLQREAPSQLNLRRPGVYVFCAEGKAIYAGSSIDEKRGVLSRLEAYRKPRVAKMRADKQLRLPRPVHSKLRQKLELKKIIEIFVYFPKNRFETLPNGLGVDLILGVESWLIWNGLEGNVRGNNAFVAQPGH